MQAVLPIRPFSQNHENTLCGSGAILAKGNVLRIEAKDADGAVLRSVSGILWVTQEGLPGDVILQSGDEYRSFSEGLIVIEALESAEFARIPGRSPTPG